MAKDALLSKQIFELDHTDLIIIWKENIIKYYYLT
jgi:hypothetical protein